MANVKQRGNYKKRAIVVPVFNVFAGKVLYAIEKEKKNGLKGQDTNDATGKTLQTFI